MFRLLSKETGIFSLPIYIGMLLFVMVLVNTLSVNFLNVFSNLLAFVGMALGYVLFNKIGLNRQSHLPLVLYSVFILAFYGENLDIGISVSLLTNSLLLFFLTDDAPKLREKSYFFIGSLLAVNFIFLPTIWPMILFVLIHIIATSDNILENIIKFILGGVFVALGYFLLMYFLGYNEFNEEYFPLVSNQMMTDFSELYFLIPTLIFSVLAIIDHFIHFNEKSPRSKFKYSFVMAFLLTQCLILTFYMGHNTEYLLLLAFPVSIIVSRFLRFLKKYWLQEVGFWIIVVSCMFSIKFNIFFTLF